MSDLSKQEREVMCHALGLQLRGTEGGTAYRNHFATDPDDPIWTKLVARGLAQRSAHMIPGGLVPFFVSPDGRTALLGMSEVEGRKFTYNEIRVAYGLEPVKVSRRQERYMQFLREDPPMKFGEWLKERHGK